MATRQFFRRSGVGKPMPPSTRTKTPRKPSLKGLTVITAAPDGRGTRLYSATRLAQLQGAQRGGRTSQATGHGHRWSSETATKAARKLWDKKYRVNQRIQKRLGYPHARQEPLDYPLLRTRHAAAPVDGIWYDAQSCTWMIQDDLGTRRLGERTALQRLGYLPHTSIPAPGTTIAVIPRQRRHES